MRRFNVFDGSANSISALAESGASNDVAIIVLAADTTLTDEVRKQCPIVAILGIKYVVLVVNKLTSVSRKHNVSKIFGRLSMHS